jgi:hypothetical protein
MRVIAANDDEVGVVLSRQEAAVITAALSVHNGHTLHHQLRMIYAPSEVTVSQPMAHAMPMFDWLKKWIVGRL